VKECSLLKVFKFSLYVYKFIGLHNYNSVLCNRNAKSSLSDLSEVEKEHVIVQINPSSIIVCGKEHQHDDENKVYNQYVHPIP
jgi:hypothetical protein